MRVIVTADIHNGYPNKLDDTIWAMRTMYEYAKSNNIEKIIILGDLFHNREYISIDVLNAVFNFFHDSSDVEWIAFPGNHDMFMKTSWDINSVSPLRPYINVINKISAFSIDGRRFVVVPFMHFEHEYMGHIKYLESQFGEDDIILTHIGVHNALNNSCFLLKYWSSVDLSSCKFNLILTGHFHNHQIIGDKVCYPGSPIPFRFDEGMVPHGFIDMDTDSLDVNFVNIRDCQNDGCPCDFVTVGDEYYNDLDGSKFKGNMVRLVLSREYSKSEMDNIRDNIISKGALSVSWTTLKNESSKSVILESSEPVVIGDDVFNSWLKTVDVSKYNVDLLNKLHGEISVEAEDLYVRSADDE